MKQNVLLYFIIFTIPLLLGLAAWQSTRYTALNNETIRLEAAQEELVEENKRTIANIAVLSSSGRIENIALNELGLTKALPENILQISIERREGAGSR